jgi:hypothetical protein
MLTPMEHYIIYISRNWAHRGALTPSQPDRVLARFTPAHEYLILKSSFPICQNSKDTPGIPFFFLVPGGSEAN